MLPNGDPCDIFFYPTTMVNSYILTRLSQIAFTGINIKIVRLVFCRLNIIELLENNTFINCIKIHVVSLYGYISSYSYEYDEI